MQLLVDKQVWASRVFWGQALGGTLLGVSVCIAATQFSRIGGGKEAAESFGKEAAESFGKEAAESFGKEAAKSFGQDLKIAAI
eukprot:379695-Rhodomonas_salina.1